MENQTIHTIQIDDFGTQGEGIGKADGYTLFVEGAVPGDLVSVQVVSAKKNYGKAKIIKVIEPSPHRKKADCAVFFQCGGCTLRHVDYQTELAFKRKMVVDALARIGGIRTNVADVAGMENPLRYRNKTIYHFGRTKKGFDCGFYQSGSHLVAPVRDCLISHGGDRAIVKTVLAYQNANKLPTYDPQKHKGLMRHLIIRRSHDNGDFVVCIVINGKKLHESSQLIAALRQNPHFKGLSININTKKGSEILGPNTEILWGENTITEQIGGLRYLVSTDAFMQVNTLQAQVLYGFIRAALPKDATIFDIYCGMGAIALYLSGDAKTVYGIDANAQAIRNAQQNKQLNGISNVHLITADAAAGLTQLQEEGVHADVVIIDPPRAGCDEKLLQLLLLQSLKQIIYVSCNPSTLARDLAVLGAGFDVASVQPVDLFPGVFQVETVVLLQKQNT